MNKAKLKSYAPQARKDFIAAVTARANLLGLSDKADEKVGDKAGDKAGQLDVAPSQPQGDVTVIAGQAWPAKVHTQREQLIARIQKDGFAQTMEAIAYTWFNRFAALRYMELHDYLGHGHRALSSEQGTLPDILTHATDLANADAGNALPGLSAAKVTELKLAGNRDGELYRMLLVAQCNALSRAMPFLFERIDDDSELLLPDNLLRSDSVIAKLVEAIPEEDWAEVEIIGWLYQFYISEKKDQVIGKVVKSEDIPAATQLFTPNWIVQYLVQNSVGRLWLMANPQSTLASEWPYYITPAEQTPEVQAQLVALIQTRVREDGDTLNPESITVLDPACGSGHILVVAYDVLKAIYLERGYQPRAIPRLILEKNLYGLDIDDRAAQMAGFALLMKARADDRRLFTTTDDAGNLQPPKLNVLSLQESKGLSVDELATHLAPFKVQRATITALVETFEHAKTFGSLIQIPYGLKTQLAVLPEMLALVKQSGELYASAAADDLLLLVQQAQVLTMQFDALVVNPPYMGGKGMNPALKDYARVTFPNSKSDLFAMFIERGFEWCKASGFNSMVTMQSWMFLSSFEAMRDDLLQKRTIQTMAHLGSRAFSEITGEIVQTTAFVLLKNHTRGFKPVFFRLIDGLEDQKRNALLSGQNRYAEIQQEELLKIPGSPLAYWTTAGIRKIFSNNILLDDVADVRQGLRTGDNDLFLRSWNEVSLSKVGFGFLDVASAHQSKKKWFPYNKGGSQRKWYGNNDYLISFDVNSFDVLSRQGNKLPSRQYYFKPSVTWAGISGGDFSVRICEAGFVFDGTGSCLFNRGEYSLELFNALLNSNSASHLLEIISPTISFEVGHIKRIPVPLGNIDAAKEFADQALRISRIDWDSFETSWGFSGVCWAQPNKSNSSLHFSWHKWQNSPSSALM